VFVRLDWKKLTNDKHSIFLRKSVIYGQKKFYNIGPRHHIFGESVWGFVVGRRGWKNGCSRRDRLGEMLGSSKSPEQIIQVRNINFGAA
jgi:hypothetical protein